MRTYEVARRLRALLKPTAREYSSKMGIGGSRIKEDEKRRQLDRQRREKEEKERIQKEEVRFGKLKEELINYDFQTGPRIKKESFQDLVVKDINVLRIVLIGPAGSGKTSFAGKKMSVFNCMLRETYFSSLQAMVAGSL